MESVLIQIFRMQGNKNEEIYKERERYRHKAFVMMLEIAVVLAIPAFTALIWGAWLDGKYQSSNTYKTILLIGSFLFSWVLIIIKYIRFNRQIKETDKKIRELEQKQNGHNSDSSRQTDNRF